MNTVELVIDGVTWEVTTEYIYPVGIGEAVELATAGIWELPTTRMVDAIWQAAPVKISPPIVRYVDPRSRPAQMLNHEHDGTPATMSTAHAYDIQSERIHNLLRDARVGLAAIGNPDPMGALTAGSHKDIVQDPITGKVGIYGWHRLDGTPIQPFYTGHALSWKDYSQGLRLCRRVG